MTTYTFEPDPSSQFVDWDDPDVWVGQMVPNSPTADVILPADPIVISTGGAYASYITILASESYTVQSLDMIGPYVILDGTLHAGSITIGPNSEINFDGGSLYFNSFTSSAYDIQGSGAVTTTNDFTNTQKIIGSGLVVTAPSLLNSGGLIATPSQTQAAGLTINLTGGNQGSDFANGVLTGGLYESLNGGALDLNVGNIITDVQATVLLDNGGVATPDLNIFDSFDAATNTYVPLQMTLQNVGPSGVLILDAYGYTTANTLTVDGTVVLDGMAVISTSGLNVQADGTVEGFGTIVGPLTNNGLIESGSLPTSLATQIINEQTTGELLIESAVSGTGSLNVGSGSTLELGGAVSESVSFSDSTGTLILDDPATFSGAIAPVTSGGRPFATIVLEGISDSSVTGYAYSGNAAGGILTIDEGASSQTLSFTGSFTTADFSLSAGPQFISSEPPSLEVQVACYCTGTLIQADTGARPVESLAIGDIVTTASGQRRAIKWIGRRGYAGRFLAANPKVQPIRLRAGALGDALPRRDLLVSPEHAMFLDGMLVPARLLVNGSTIVQQRALDRVEYVHVELDSHDLLLAEGAPCESFVDDESRGMFHNAAEFAALYPDAPSPAGYCAPRVEDGYALEAIRQRLAAVSSEMKARHGLRKRTRCKAA